MAASGGVGEIFEVGGADGIVALVFATEDPDQGPARGSGVITKTPLPGADEGVRSAARLLIGRPDEATY